MPHERVAFLMQVLTKVDYTDGPPGLHVEVQWCDWQVLLGNALVHTPQELLCLAFVHDGNILVTANPNQLHNVCSLKVKTPFSTHACVICMICCKQHHRYMGFANWAYRKVGNLVIGFFLSHDCVQEVTIVLEWCDTQHPAYIIAEVIRKQLQQKNMLLSETKFWVIAVQKLQKYILYSCSGKILTGPHSILVLSSWYLLGSPSSQNPVECNAL